jgi:hypothetical protein
MIPLAMQTPARHICACALHVTAGDDTEDDDWGEDPERQVHMARCHVCGAICGTRWPGMVECTCGTWFEIHGGGSS